MIQTSNAYFTYKKGRTIEKVPVDEIIYIESFLRKMAMHLTDGRQETFYGNFKDVYQEKLHKYGFIQVHRSFVVNSSFIAEIKNLELILIDGETLPIAENRQKEVKAAFSNILERVILSNTQRARKHVSGSA